MFCKDDSSLEGAEIATEKGNSLFSSELDHGCLRLLTVGKNHCGSTDYVRSSYYLVRGERCNENKLFQVDEENVAHKVRYNDIFHRTVGVAVSFNK